MFLNLIKLGYVEHCRDLIVLPRVICETLFPVGGKGFREVSNPRGLGGYENCHFVKVTLSLIDML